MTKMRRRLMHMSLLLIAIVWFVPLAAVDQKRKDVIPTQDINIGRFGNNGSIICDNKPSPG